MNTSRVIEFQHSRIRSLRAEIRTLKDLLTTCENQTRLLIERRRSEGETVEERINLRRRIGSTWVRQFEEIAVDAGPSGAGTACPKVLIDKCKTYINQLRRSQRDGITDDELIDQLDAETNELAELAIELQRVIDGGELDVQRKPNMQSLASKPAIEILRSAEKKEKMETTSDDYIHFVVVDEFGRELNAPAPPRAKAVMDANTDRNARGISRMVRPAKSPSQLSRTSQLRRSLVAASDPVYQRGRLRPITHPSQARSASELPENVSWEVADEADADAGRRPGETSNRASTTARRTLRLLANGPAHRNIRVPATSENWRRSRRVLVKESELNTARPKETTEGEHWSASQRQWARMLSNSCGASCLDEGELEQAAEANGTSFEQQLAEEYKRREADVRAFETRSLLFGLLAFPPKPPLESDRENVAIQKSDIVRDTMLTSLLQDDSSVPVDPDAENDASENDE